MTVTTAPPRGDTTARSSPSHFVYIVRCVDGTLYTGYARDPDERARVHNRGRGAKYTAGRRPVALIHVEPFRSKSRALRREHQIKRWPRAKKEALCRGDLNAIRHRHV
jgi:putative endonuclease